jgi:hypothetical protein
MTPATHNSQFLGRFHTKIPIATTAAKTIRAGRISAMASPPSSGSLREHARDVEGNGVRKPHGEAAAFADCSEAAAGASITNLSA